jgi:hypothetical protein
MLATHDLIHTIHSQIGSLNNQCLQEVRDKKGTTAIEEYLERECGNELLLLLNKTLLFDQLKQWLLHMICENGSCTLSHQVLDSLEQLFELSWSKIHSGEWRYVKQGWRRAIALSCWCWSLISMQHGLFEANDSEQIKTWTLDQWKQVLYRLDIGLMMGDDQYRDFIHDLIESVHNVVISLYPIQLPMETNEAAKDTSRLTMLMNRSDKSSRIPIVRNMSLQMFKNEFMNTNTPVIINVNDKDELADPDLLDLNLLMNIAGYRTVPVELGDDYLADDWSQNLMFFHEYIEKYMLSSAEQLKKGYLAQHNLFEQVRPLRKLLCEPLYCAAGEGQLEHVNVWIGPKGTKSPLHTDKYYNILVQLIGSKYVRLYSSEYNDSMYPNTNQLFRNSSQIRSLEQVDVNRFPKFAQTPYWEGVLEAGQMLFIPRNYWHYIESLSTSFSVSFWYT